MSPESRATILLGPTNELHAGVHGALMANPPAGCEYLTQPATHYFLLPKGVRLFEALSPHRYFHIGEFLYFETDADWVHSARFPVLDRTAWVMDLDNYGYPFVAGRSVINPIHRRNLIEGNGLHELAQQRVENMLFACDHPSCRGVMFRTETALRSAAAQIAARRPNGYGKAFLAKARVVYPAQAPIARDLVTSKWDALEAAGAPFTIVFCGRDFAVKNGELALDVFERVLARHPGVRIIYVGRIPDDVRDRRANVLGAIEFHDHLPRTEVLDRLAGSHVLVHPSWNESLGIIYLEAFAAGLAVIGAHGDNLRHVTEVLSAEGARIVDYCEGSRADWVESYVSFIESLIDNPSMARRMGEHNYDLVASDSGKFSLLRRDQELRALYDACLDQQPALQLEDLPHWRNSVPFTMESQEIQIDFAQYAREIGFSGFNLVV